MKIYTADQTTARALQAKLRAAKGYPCCQCHVTPSKDCSCTDHRRSDGTILPGPHSPLSVAREAVDVRENPKARGEYFVSVPSAYEKHLRTEDRAPMIERTIADVTESFAVAAPVEEKLTDEKVILGDEVIEVTK